MGRMSRFLRFCAFLSVLFFTTNVFAAGYSCPTYKKYTSCSAGYYMTNSSGTTYNGTPAVGNLCTICPKGYYCTGGTENKVACSAGRYGSSTGLRTSACSGVISAGRYGSAGATSANGSGAVSAGYYSSGGGTSATPTAAGNGCLSGYKCGKVSTGCYGSAGATTDCPNGCPAGYQAGEGTTAQSNCLASCAAGTRVATANAACTAITSGNVYMLAHTVKYGQTSEEATRCPSNYTISGTTQADHDAKDDCKITCSAGTRVTTADATCSSISSSTGYYITSHTVSAGYTSPAATQCPENYRTGAGTTSQSNCLASCSAGYAVLTENSACATIQNSTYMGKYTTAHTVKYGDTSTISTCPGGYRDGAGTTAQSNCLASCAAGSRVATANEACSAITSGNVYMLAHTVNYGQTSAAATSCPSSYTISGTAQADHDAKDDCKISCNAGTRVTTADATCSSISGSTGYYITSHTVSAGLTSPAATQCPENYRSGAGTTSQANCSLTTTAGKYVATAGAGETACISPYYCPGGTTIKYGTGTTTGGNSACTDLGAIYSKSDAGASASTNCYATTTSTKWVASAKASSESTCTAGYYCAGGTKVYYNSTGGRTECGAGKYSAEGATSCSNIIAGCYGTSASSSCPAVCGANKYSDAGASACTACDSDYANSGNTAESHAGVASCKVTCAAGTYVASSGAACTDVGSGYYTTESQTISQGSTGSRSACSSLNAFYTASDSGRNATTDCFGTTTSGKFVKTAKSGEETCTAGGYCPGSVKVYYNSTGGRTACGAGTANANTGSSASSACLTCAAGTYSTGGASSCSTVNDGCYGGASATSACPNSCSSLNSFYTKSDNGRDANTDCYGTTTSGNWIKTQKSGQVTCDAGGYCPGSVKVYYNSTGGRTACGAGKYNASTGSSSSSACANITAGCYGTSASSACPAVCATNKWSAAGASSCTSCPTDYENSGDTSASHANQSSCKITVDGGYYIGTAGDNSSNWDKCAGGTYKASHTVAYGGTSSCATCSAGYYCPEGASGQTECGGNTKYSSSGASACSTVSTGYYTTGGTSTTRTGQTKCEAGNYCSGGVKTECGGGKYSAEGATSCSSITAGCYGTSASSACPAVCGANKYSDAGASSCSSCPTDYKNSGDTATAHAGSASCIITVSGGYYIGTAGDNSSNWDKCSAGYYKAAHSVAYGSTSSCSACGAVNKYSAAGASACSTVDTGYYTTGGTTTTRTGQSQCKSGTYCTDGVQNTCPSGYGASAAGSDAAADCYMSVAATKYVKAANDSSASACGTGTYKAAHTVYYGGTSTCSSCPSGYDDGAAVATQAECVISVAGGKYVGTANSATLSTCECGTYKAQHSVAYGSTSSCTTTSAGYYAAEGASSQTQASAGYYAAAGACEQTVLNNGCYGSAGASTACPNNCNALTAPAVTGGTFSSVTPRSANTACRYVAPSKTDAECTSITANTVSYSGTAWGTNFYTAKANKGSYVSATGNTAAPACTTCSKGYYQASDNSTAASCTPADKGYYVDTTGASAQKQCTAGTYTSSTAQSSCSTITSGCWGAAGATSACPNNCNALTAPAVTGGTFSSVTPRSANTACRYVAPSKTYTGCSSITANTVSYSGTAWGTDFYTTKASKGYRVTATGNTSAPACTACACGTYQGTDDSTTTTCTTTSAGYYAKGTGNSSQTQADAGYYAAAGACDQTKIQAGCFGGEGSASACPNSCPAAESGWTLASTTGLKVVTDCAEITTPSTSGSPIATICTAGTLTKKATNSTTWGSATASGLTAKAGRYVNGTTCSACAAGTYTSSATTKTSCTPAAAGYYVSGTEATSQTACPAGTYGSTTGLTSSACSGKCTAGYYCPAASTSATQNECTAGNYCPAGAGAETSCATVGGKLYVNSAAKSDAATDCYISLASKVYLASATSTSTTTCTAGYYCPGGNFYYSSSATNQGRSSCTGTTYSGSGAASCSDCPSGYTANTESNKTAASQCQISCAAGTQVATANAQCTTPSGNWYTTASQLVNYGSTSSVNACKVATNLFNPSDYDSLWGYITSSSTTVGAYDVNAIVWVPVEPNTTYIVSGMRGANTMTVANSASVPAIGVKISNFVDPGSVGKGMLYTTSSDAKYLILQGLRDADRATTSTRQSVLDKNVANLQIFKASDGYGIIGNATTDHDAVEDCKITCGPGQYVATEDSACVNVGAGYYAAGGAVSYGSTSTNRSQCASGLTTIGYGTGANEAADCGRKLHAGDNVIYLRSAERTSPSLRVKVGDKTFFGALSTALSGALKVKNGSTTYSVVNDWQ